MTKANVVTITPPNSLSKARSGTGPVKFDPEVLRKAEEAMSLLENDYGRWVQQDIDALRELIEDMQRNPDNLAPAIAGIYRHALDMKGQGGGFGYGLITEIGELLTKFMDGRRDISERDRDIICAHVDAMQAVIRGDIKGSGGEIGREIVSGLRALVLKDSSL